MNTDQLIALLAAGNAPVSSRAWIRLPAMATVLGTGFALLLMGALMGLRPDLAQAVYLPMFWVKLLFPLTLAVAAFVATSRLSRPGMPLGQVGWALAMPVALIWALGIAAWAGATPAERPVLLFGETWLECMIFVSALAIPAFVALITALRRLAPTRPALAGAMAGLLSGAVAASAYALHCPELHAPFIGIWYLIGMAIPAVAGALAGPRLLRW